MRQGEGARWPADAHRRRFSCDPRNRPWVLTLPERAKPANATVRRFWFDRPWASASFICLRLFSFVGDRFFFFLLLSPFPSRIFWRPRCCRRLATAIFFSLRRKRMAIMGDARGERTESTRIECHRLFCSLKEKGKRRRHKGFESSRACDVREGGKAQRRATDARRRAHRTRSTWPAASAEANPLSEQRMSVSS